MRVRATGWSEVLAHVCESTAAGNCVAGRRSGARPLRAGKACPVDGDGADFAFRAKDRYCAARPGDDRVSPCRVDDVFDHAPLGEGAEERPLLDRMRTSVRMIERHYGALLDGAHNVIASRLDAFEAELEKAVGE